MISQPEGYLGTGPSSALGPGLGVSVGC